MADGEETDVNYLQFGKDFEDVEFIANASVSVLLDTIKKSDETKRYPEAFEKSLKYTQKFGGALQTQQPEAIDELFEGLGALEFLRETDDGDVKRLKLQSYEIVALTNLNPSTAAAAKSLIPSLEKLTDEELESEVLKLLRRSSARYTGLEQ